MAFSESMRFSWAARSWMNALASWVAIAAGQKTQVEVLGQEATRQLRQFELTLDTIAKFANANPQVIAAALTNASKFVPQTSINLGDGRSGSLLDAAGLLGGLLTAGQAPAPAPPPPPRTAEPR